MMPESKLPKKTEGGQENFICYSASRTNGELQSKVVPNASPLRVRFALPEGDLEQAKTHTANKEIIALPTLPSICEFTTFSRNRSPTKPEKQVSQVRPYTRLPPMYSNARLGGIGNKQGANDGASGELTTNKKTAKANKGPVSCTKQDIQIEVKCKLPEDYRDPTYKETKKRIWDWLRQCEEHKPAYLRRADAFRKTVNLNEWSDTQWKTFQLTSLPERPRKDLTDASQC